VTCILMTAFEITCGSMSFPQHQVCTSRGMAPAVESCGHEWWGPVQLCYCPDVFDRSRRQVTLRGPADIQGSVSLRGEEDGWWGRAESSLLAAVLAAGGHPDATPDEFFFQVLNLIAGMV
jgi:hypothetical protein